MIFNEKMHSSSGAGSPGLSRGEACEPSLPEAKRATPVGMPGKGSFPRRRPAPVDTRMGSAREQPLPDDRKYLDPLVFIPFERPVLRPGRAPGLGACDLPLHGVCRDALTGGTRRTEGRTSRRAMTPECRQAVAARAPGVVGSAGGG